MNKPYESLKSQFDRIHQMREIAAVLEWDQAVNMPPGGLSDRTAQLQFLKIQTLQALTHGDLKDALEKCDEDKLSPLDKRNFALMKKEHLCATVIDEALMSEFTKESMACTQLWQELKPKGDWKSFYPLLNQTYLLKREIAQCLSSALDLSPYDALLDSYSPGLRESHITPIFNSLKEKLPNLIQTITDKQNHQPPQLPKVSIDTQRRLSQEMIKLLGFDDNKGRLDESHHPFTGGTQGDVRITTKYIEEDFTFALMGTCHEIGHALYQQHLPEDWNGQPIGQSMGMCIHESQSLFVEMILCRSTKYIDTLFELLKNEESFNSMEKQTLFQKYTQVKPGFIRIEADEVTYPMHIVLRSEIETDLFNDRIEIKELPDVWEEKMKKYLGLQVEQQHGKGAMQDIHWASGAFGYFPAYTFGALIAAQLNETIRQQHPEFSDLESQAYFQAHTDWLNKNIHARGAELDTMGLIQDVTGKELSVEPYLKHIQAKYL